MLIQIHKCTHMHTEETNAPIHREKHMQVYTLAYRWTCTHTCTQMNTHGHIV